MEIRELREENEANRARIDELETKMAAPPMDVAAAPPGDRSELLAGDDRFVVTGWGAAGFDWDRNENSSSFGATVAPIFLYRVGERVLFEVEPELELEEEGGTEVNLEYAQGKSGNNGIILRTGYSF